MSPPPGGRRLNGWRRTWEREFRVALEVKARFLRLFFAAGSAGVRL